jgi:purine-binding chemotaxis protein CheW
MSAAISTETRQLCTFLVDGLTFGIDVAWVQEIIRYQEMTTVPLAPYPVRGLINLRGQIVTAIDMRRRLGLPDLANGKRPINVVLQTEEGVISLLVDKIGDVVDVQGGPDDPPETLSGNILRLIEGVYQLESFLLMVLNAKAAVEVS